MQLLISEKATPVVPLVVRPEWGQVVPVMVRLMPPVAPGAPVKASKNSHLVVPLGVRPVALVQHDAEGVVALGSRLLRHMKKNLVTPVNKNAGKNLMIAAIKDPEVNVVVLMNL